jgi:hypothetical protein
VNTCFGLEEIGAGLVQEGLRASSTIQTVHRRRKKCSSTHFHPDQPAVSHRVTPNTSFPCKNDKAPAIFCADQGSEKCKIPVNQISSLSHITLSVAVQMSPTTWPIGITLCLWVVNLAVLTRIDSQRLMTSLSAHKEAFSKLAAGWMHPTRVLTEEHQKKLPSQRLAISK